MRSDSRRSSLRRERTYYDLVVPPFDGYILLPDPTVTHFQLAAGSTPPTKVLQVYKPVTLTANFRQSDGTPFVGTVNFTVSNSRGSKSFTYTGSPVTITSITNSTTGGHRAPRPGDVHDHGHESGGCGLLHRCAGAERADDPVELPHRPHCFGDADGRPARLDQGHGYLRRRSRRRVRRSPSAVVRARFRRRRRRRTRAGSRRSSGLPAGSGYTVTAVKGGQSAPNQSASVSDGIDHESVRSSSRPAR